MKIKNDTIYRINEDFNIWTERVVGTSICVARTTISSEWGDSFVNLENCHNKGYGLVWSWSWATLPLFRIHNFHWQRIKAKIHARKVALKSLMRSTRFCGGKRHENRAWNNETIVPENRNFPFKKNKKTHFFCYVKTRQSSS